MAELDVVVDQAIALGPYGGKAVKEYVAKGLHLACGRDAQELQKLILSECATSGKPVSIAVVQSSGFGKVSWHTPSVYRAH